MARTYTAGIVTAYGAAKEAGYTGTYEEFCEQQACFAGNAAQVAEDRAAVETIKNTFETVTVPAAVQTVQTEGATQEAAVTAKGTEQVAAVRSAGDAQTGRVQMAGAEEVQDIETAGTTQVGAVNTAGATQVNAVNAAGTTQTGNVNNAGATQMAAIEAKGEETRESIPEDYSTLTAEVSDLKSSLNEYLVTKPTYHNYFDPFSDDIHFGHYYFNSNMLDSAALACVKIELPVNKTYYLKVDVTGFGPSNAIKIPCWKASDGTYISNKNGTLDAETEILTLKNLNTQTTEDTIIIGYTFRPFNVSKSFIIDSPVTAIPPVEDLYEIPKENIFAGKKALFFGDSICQASAVPLADTNQYQFGWAGRIGYYNLMNWRNYGNSGASITNMSGRSCISTIVSTNIALHPDADYIIVEGGTNDADVIASSSDYSVGTFAEDDYTSTYDLTTFCGSLETMLRNIIKTYPNRKIGYIVAPKMGQYDGVMRNRREIFEKASAICRKWGVTFVDLWGECQINPRLVEYYDPSLTQAENISSKYYVDGQHLTDKGYDLITPLVEQWMKTM